ncbi:hypothetical protein [Gemmatimonas sp.]|uniref:hypothetical protein n=1 Tax=Gemmatimonas sp. TaxID=1962908 RepID=UPI00391D4C2B
MTRLLLLGGMTAAVFVAVGCADVGTAPDVPASIELPPFPFPSVVVGDTLRNEAGVAAPVRAVVRNAAGDVIDGARATYLYADFLRDSAFTVDTATGIIVARRVVASGRIAARIGSSLQVLRPLIATVRPDLVEAASAADPLIVSLLPDTGRARAEGNTSGELPVVVRNSSSPTAGGVNGWLVRFRLVRPANPANDTSQAVFLVDDQLRASTVDTTSPDGRAGRRVRVRAARFPTPQGNARVTDTVVVEATVRYRGRLVTGAPILLSVPVIRPASQ